MFCSTRRRGYARCFGGQFAKRWHVYTLHRMDGDGNNLQTLSWHDTNEWFPTVDNSGRVLYSRWDYIDRDAVTHQNLWATRPDGTNPVALWGNATLAPHCTFQLQPIPDSQRIVCTAAAHHSVAGGSIAIIDPEVADNGQAAITRFTPGVPFPEAEGRNIKEYYAAPWPLSETLMLVAYSPVPLVWEPRPNTDNALGLYLLDADGNRELLYRDPVIGSTNPVPLRPRARPPALPSHLPADTEPMGEMTLIDVYRGLGDVPRGTIKELRVVQIFPKLSVVANRPPIGLAGEENGRAVLGTVPVAPDGSARFRVPAQKLLSFQALDEKGRAYQVMRTATYLQPGEKMSCIGCHESRLSTHLQRGSRSLAASRPADDLRPEPFGTGPFGYARVVQPILDRHCIRCHGSTKPAKGLDLTGTPHQGFSRSYWSLCGDVKFGGGGTNPANAQKALVPRFGARNRVQITPPGGLYGARGSRLLKMLAAGHRKVVLTEDECRRLAAWIDLNAVFYGSNDEAEQAAQLRGEEIPMPKVQ
jgi:mono/diheme cytochrome c family protein